ncbi:MAG: radical SAM family heme chaperone HemW [Rhabdochlamydiaceae bacterium]|nr:radical SAM family heme chaperone HemW [Candidatus Amphrikana amoebophyrae]
MKTKTPSVIAIAGKEGFLMTQTQTTGNRHPNSSIGLYFHIPFCAKKCPYCHFFVMKGVDRHKESYLKALKKEWLLKLHQIQHKKITSIYFGGGTPTEIGSDGIGQILSWILPRAKLATDCEITVETNPDNVTPNLITELKSAGVNRISIGVQSLDNSTLLEIGRTHSNSKAEEAIHIAHQNGIKNITIDLMYDLPNQTTDSFIKTLQKLPSLPITHLSLYNLVVEEPSAFHRKKEEVEAKMPKDEISLQLLEMAINCLSQMGLSRYEISAFAKPGFESKHNTRYWQGGEFLGLGPSAFSYSNESRFQNVANLKKYSDQLELGTIPIDFSERLEYPRNVCELLAIELRLLKGVNISKFNLPSTVLKEIESLIRDNYLIKTDDRLQLTEKGTLFYDTVASTII